MNKPLICIVDDDRGHSLAMSAFLNAEGFSVHTFPCAEKFLEQKIAPHAYDLLISDINMPGMSGIELCRLLRGGPDPIRLPIILITGSSEDVDKTAGLEAGADDFIDKPFQGRPLAAKIRSLLHIRSQDVKRLEELETSQGINDQLSKFISPNIAARMSPEKRKAILEPHRTDVTVLFVDIRRFTAFSERAEPEEVIEVLREYYTAVGRAALKYRGTLGHLAGDGIMVFFNDPEPIKEHSAVAVRMAVEAREALLKCRARWDRRNYGIDFGMGVSQGFATIGGIGFDKFSQYSVIGTVTNFASRLCHMAVEGQILVSRRFLARLPEGFCEAEGVGEATLKGISKTVQMFNITKLQEAPASEAKRGA